MENFKKETLVMFIATLMIFGGVFSVKANEGNNETTNNLTKIGEAKLGVPDMFDFSPYQYFNNELKIAFIELEASNSIGVEITKENMEPFFSVIKKYIDEASNGETIVNPEYCVLEKKIVPVPIYGSMDSSLYTVAQELIEKYGNEYEGYSLVIIVDAPFSSTSGANYDNSEKLHVSAIVLGNFFDSVGTSYNSFPYVTIHEILHSFNKAKTLILDSYWSYNKNKIPELNSRYYDLHGQYQNEIHPFGSSKVKLGWKDYNIINYQINSPINITLENSCSSSKINKIPLGYVKDINHRILLKSLLLELRGFSDCELDVFPQPGVNAHYIYEDLDLLRYSYSIPLRESTQLLPYFFALENTNYYYDDNGMMYSLGGNTLDEYRLTSFLDSDFSFNLIRENWINTKGFITDTNRLTVNDRLVSTDVEIVIKSVPDDAVIKNLSIGLEFYSYENSAVIVKASTSLNAFPELTTANTFSYSASAIDPNSGAVYYCYFNKHNSNFSNSYEQVALCDKIVRNNLTVEAESINIITFLIENIDKEITFVANIEGVGMTKKEIIVNNPFIISKFSPCASYGDLDDDGFVTTVDRDMMISYSVGDITFTTEQLLRSDLDVNGQSGDAVDVNLINQYVVGDITTFPVCTEELIKVISPNGGEIMSKGSSCNISYISSNKYSCPRFTIELFKDNKFYKHIINTDVKENYKWYIPTDLPTGEDYKIKIRMNLCSHPDSCVDDYIGEDLSDNYFSINKLNQGQCLKNGTLIKLSNSPKIYTVRNCERYQIKDINEFQREGYMWENVKIITTEAMNFLPEVFEINQDIKEGSIIRAKDDIDVYIVKYIGNKKFIRLILNPSVFNSYGHLKWRDVIEVEREIMDSFVISNLVRSAENSRIYRLDANGDNGTRRHFRSISVMQRLGYDLDAVYEINETDKNSYEQGDDLE